MAVVGDVAIFLGCALVAVSAIGLHRFDDVFARLHAAGKATSLGFLLVAAGALVHELPARTWAELALASVLLLITTPVGVHVLARAAWRSGDQLAEATVIDELSDARRAAADADGDDPGH